MSYPARHVHLDFHTSEDIPGVGSRFDKKQWQAALKAGHVNSINIFAKCHHSWSYYPTKVGQMHPTLRRNLLGEQIDACHEIGVRAPIYFTVGWSANDAKTHPEWAARNLDGSVRTCNYDVNAKPTDSKPIASWVTLCPGGDYRKLILEQSAEICRTFDVDGFWYDICFDQCWCERCLAAMKDARLDPKKPEDQRTHNIRKWQSFMTECNAVLFGSHPKANVFFNGSTGIYDPQYHDYITQYEMEDLPTVWGGYDKFPLRARYFASKGKPLVAMSGKFHTMWGEFGGYKHPDAIRFEAASMIAYGSNCCFGDQLHPSGEMDLATYRNIGQAYKYVERIEELGLGGQPAANLGLWLSGQNEHDQGVTNMLLELQRDFRVVMPDTDLSTFETIVLTGDARLDKASAGRLNDYLSGGGSLLVLGTSGLDKAGRKFLIDVGARYLGPPKYEMDYTQAGTVLGKGLVDTPFVNYSAAHRVKAAAGQVLATIREPYFDRTYGHYCSHQNTPYRLAEAAHVAAVRNGAVVYLAHALGKMYYQHGARLHRDYFRNALALLHRRPALEAALPSAGRATLIHQSDRRRYVAHLLYGPPLQRGRCLVIEDLMELRNVPVTLRVPQKIRSARLGVAARPGDVGQPLKIVRAAGATRVTVPEFSCHQAVVFEY